MNHVTLHTCHDCKGRPRNIKATAEQRRCGGGKHLPCVDRDNCGAPQVVSMRLAPKHKHGPKKLGLHSATGKLDLSHYPAFIWILLCKNSFASDVNAAWLRDVSAAIGERIVCIQWRDFGHLHSKVGTCIFAWLAQHHRPFVAAGRRPSRAAPLPCHAYTTAMTLQHASLINENSVD